MNSGRWFLVQVAPQLMGTRLPSDMVGQAFERRRRLFQALLGAVDRAYRAHRPGLLAGGDIVRVSMARADRMALPQLSLTPGPRDRQVATTLSVSADAVVELAGFEGDRPAPEH